MIKTHKPRGHIWTHSSAFQQTKGYREISYEECMPPLTKVLVPDPDDQLSASQRATKRRKLEKLTNDFLNGRPLYISSARPCPQAVKATIVRNKKCCNDSKFVLPKLDSSPEPSAVWEDLPDDLEILKAAARKRNVTKPPIKTNVISSETVIEESRMQATCSPARGLRAFKVNFGPSDDALQQAAALRARRVQRANSEMPAISRLASRLEPTIEDSEEREPRSEPRLGTVDRDLTRRTNEWLSRRSSRLCLEAQDAGESSVDELRLSAVETPSRLVRRTSARSQQKRSDDEPAMEQIASYHTAPEDTDISIENVQPTNHKPDTQEDSQSRLLRSHGVPARQRLSWTTMNETAHHHKATPENAAAATPADAPTSLSAVHESLLESAHSNAGKATKRRRTTFNATRTPQQSRRTRSAPTTKSQDAATMIPPPASSSKPLGEQAVRPVYRKIPTETTPFMCRPRRGLGPHDGDARQEIAAMQEQKRKGRRRVTFPSSESPETDDQYAAIKRKGVQNPPVLDMSFGHDSAFAPELNMALVDEHLNKVLPTEPESAGKTSAVKRSLRRELRDSGAEISRCASEPPTSPRLEPATEELAAQQWAGTQAVLQRAEKDLLTSPEKANTEHTTAVVATPRFTNTPPATEPPTNTSRSPLKQLSQEPLPSTQALLGDWQGFSTVKKPRHGYRESPLPTSTAVRGACDAKTALERSRLSSSSLSDSRLPTNEPARRSSSLRFSTTSLATPVPSPAPASSLKSAMKSHKSAVDMNATADATEDEVSQSFVTTGVALSSFQAAQASMSQTDPPASPRDDSNLERTIDDLTREMLGIGDMDGVLSQVG